MDKDNPTKNGALAPINRARKALAEAKTVTEVKAIRDKGHAAIQWAKQQRDVGLEATNDACEIVLLAERRLGDMLGEMEFDKGGRPPENRSHDVTGSSLAELGIHKMQSSRWQAEARVPEPKFQEWVTKTREAGKQLTSSALVKLGKKKDREGAKISPEEFDDPPRVWCMSWENWLPTQPDCDLLLTDPPYMTDVENIDAFADSWLHTALAKVKPTGRAYVCIGAYPAELLAYLRHSPPDHLVRDDILVWTYRNTIGPSSKHNYNRNWQAILVYRGVDAPPLNCPELNEQFAVQDITAPDGRHGNRYHPWQKPDELGERFVRHATKPGDLVLDPFCCTGTFVLAAHRFGREGRGCDISDEYLQIAIQRGCVSDAATKRRR